MSPAYLFATDYGLAAWILTALAGIAAEDRYSRNDLSLFRSGLRDIAEARENWNRLRDVTNDACGRLGDLERFASRAVKHYWYAIAPVARVLLERKTIEGEELGNLLADSVWTDSFTYLPLAEVLLPQQAVASAECVGENTP